MVSRWPVGRWVIGWSINGRWLVVGGWLVGGGWVVSRWLIGGQ